MSASYQSSMGTTHLLRMLAFVRAIVVHSWTLLATVLGSFVLSIPSWIEPLLSPQHSAKLNAFLAISPQTYRYLAMAFLICGLLYASFLAWKEQCDALEDKTSQLLALKSQMPALRADISKIEINRLESGIPAAIVDIEVINSGSPTGVREWAGYIRRRDGARAFFSNRIAVENLSLGERRNFVDDDWYFRKGERRLGRIAFPIQEPAADIFQVCVTFQDYLGTTYSASCPSDDLMKKMEASNQLPWQQKNSQTQRHAALDQGKA
jgi:hypothetical protein